MTGYFVWLASPKGPVAQKWALDCYHVEKAQRQKGDPRATMLAEHFLDSIRWELSIDELSKIYLPPE